VLFMNERQDKM